MLIRLVAVIFSTVLLVACAQEGEPPSLADDANETAQGGIAAVAEADVTEGDIQKGKRVYIFCQSCHTLNEGGMHKVGPNLYGMMGQKAAQADGFIYSDALANSGITWDEATLDKWITRPTELVPGTTMVFAGVTDPQQRADLIAYLVQASAE